MSLRDLPGLRLNTTPRKGILPIYQEGATIPKILHQTYSSRALPENILENVKRIRAMNPSWDYRFYDESDRTLFIKDEYGVQMLKYYRKISQEYRAARADLFRYLVLYRHGGVYLDVKSTATRPLDKVVMSTDCFLLSHWKNTRGGPYPGWGLHPELKNLEHGEFQQWFIVSVPGHPFLQAIIENVLGNLDRYTPGLHRTGAWAVFRVTGPIAYSLAIAPLLHEAPHRIVDSEEDLGFRYSIFDNPAEQAHKKIFTSHYAELKTSLTYVGKTKTAIFAVYRVIAAIYKFFAARPALLMHNERHGVS